MKIKATKRKILGKKTKGIRKDEKIPAVIFTKNQKSEPVTIDLMDFVKVYKKAGETSLIDMEVEGKSDKVIVKEVQLDPVSLDPIHASFYKVNLKQKIRAAVPVNVIGEENNELIKKGEALALILLNEIEVEALPMNLPSEFTIDVSGLEEVGNGIVAGQLDYNREEVELIEISDETPIVKMDWAEMKEVEEEKEELTEEELIGGIEVTEETEENDTEEGGNAPQEPKEPQN